MANMPIYTAILGAFLIVLQIALMLRVGVQRAKGAAIGHEGNPDLERKVRRHANLAENAGLFVAVIALFEMIAGQTPFVLGVCIAFALSRLAHAFGFSSLAGSHGEGTSGERKLYLRARMAGATGTALTGFAVAIGIGLAVAGV